MTPRRRPTRFVLDEFSWLASESAYFFLRVSINRRSSALQERARV